MPNVEVTVNTKFKLIGRWTIKKWKAGVLPAMMGLGLDLSEAKELAETLGYLSSVQAGENLITTNGKTGVAQYLIDPTGYDGLTYFAIGTDNTVPNIAQTELGAEHGRKVWSLTPSIVGTTVQYTVFFLSTESDVAIEEAGVFGISGATGAADSGTMFSRYLVSEDNSAGDFDLTFDYNLEVN